jgi:hypothetical protein
MSVDSKIKDLLGRVKAQATDAESLSEENMQPMGSTSVTKDTSVKSANTGDATSPMQGSSQKASFETRDENEENQGAKVSSSIKKNNLQAKGVGTATNFMTVGDTSMAVNQPNSAGNVQKENTEVIPSLKEQIVSIFGEDVSESFVDKATSIFEAAIIARVNSELEKIVEELEEQNLKELAEAKEQLVNKIDSFLNYVVEQWMADNELAIENGLRTEIAEDFISGLKTLFQEHYIEVPEEKYNIIDNLQTKTQDLEEKLNETLENNMKMRKELEGMKRQSVLENATKDLADTESERLFKLLEGVDFENENLFSEKVAVIKENYFPKIKNMITTENILPEDDSDSTADMLVEDSSVSKYAKALSRTIRKKQ